MKLYNVTVTRIGSVELYADSVEEAMRLAEESDVNQMFWMDEFSATDAEEIEKES